MKKSFISPKEYYKKLPTKRMAAGVLIFNKKKEVLILKPSYKDHWTIPGGVIEKNESPMQGCARETNEEIGIKIKKLKLVCLDYTSSKNHKGDSIQFIFTCPTISERMIHEIKIDGKEVIDLEFTNIKSALKKLSEHLAIRIKEAINALNKNKVVYLENGKPV